MTITATDGDGDTVSTDVSSDLVLKFSDDKPQIVAGEAKPWYGNLSQLGEETFSMLDTNGNRIYETLAEVENGEAKATITFNSGLDSVNTKITVNGVTATWDGTTWSGTDVTYNSATGVITLGDVTFTPKDGFNKGFTGTHNFAAHEGAYEVSYDTTKVDDKYLNVIITDGDGDTAQLEIINPNFDTPGDKIDDVAHRPGFDGLLNWSASAAYPGQTPEQDANIEYKEDNFIASVGDGGDSVQMGEHNDVIFLGDSHASQMGQDDDPAKAANAQAAMESFMSKTDSEIVQDATNEDSFLSTEFSGQSNAYIDFAHGGGGDDQIYGQNGVDAIFGGSGDDYIHGGAGNDGLRGGSGNDEIYGGSGEDILHGGAGADILLGGDGNDTIYFDLSDKVVKGGNGHDLFILQDSIDGIKYEDLLVDGGEEEGSIDVLLSGLDTVEAVQEAFSKNDSLSNMDVIMLGDDMEAAQKLQDSLVNNKERALDGWTQGEEVTIGNVTYREYSKSDSEDSMKALIENNLFG